MLRIHQLFHTVRDRLDTDTLEIIMLAPGQDRDRYFVDLRRRQNEDHIFRRLLQCLQQCIERSYGKHMHLVDDIDFISALCRTVCHLLTDLPDIVNTVIGGRIDLDHIHGRAGRYGPACLTFPAGASVHRVLTVHRLRKYLRHGRLACSPCPAEKICMSDPVGPDLILQCCNDMILPFYIRKFGRAELSVKRRI